MTSNPISANFQSAPVSTFGSTSSSTPGCAAAMLQNRQAARQERRDQARHREDRDARYDSRSESCRRRSTPVQPAISLSFRTARRTRSSRKVSATRFGRRRERQASRKAPTACAKSAPPWRPKTAPPRITSWQFSGGRISARWPRTTPVRPRAYDCRQGHAASSSDETEHLFPHLVKRCGQPERILISVRINPDFRQWWGRQDSNLRSHEAADLQSAPFATRDTPPLDGIAIRIASRSTDRPWRREDRENPFTGSRPGAFMGERRPQSQPIEAPKSAPEIGRNCQCLEPVTQACHE